MTHHSGLVFILVFVIVVSLFLNNVQLDGIKSDDLELDSTLFTLDSFAFVHVDIDMNVGIAFWARSGGHLLYLRHMRILLTGRGLRSRTPSVVRLFNSNLVNLTAAQRFLQYSW